MSASWFFAEKGCSLLAREGPEHMQEVVLEKTVLSCWMLPILPALERRTVYSGRKELWKHLTSSILSVVQDLMKEGWPGAGAPERHSVQGTGTKVTARLELHNLRNQCSW